MKKLLLISALLLILTIAGCSQAKNKQSINQNGLNQQTNSTSEEFDVETVNRVDAETFDSEAESVEGVILSGNLKSCESLESNNLVAYCKDQINYNLAIQRKSKRHCEDIADSTLKVDCLDSYNIEPKE